MELCVLFEEGKCSDIKLAEAELNSGKTTALEIWVGDIVAPPTWEDISSYETAADNPVDWIEKQERKSHFWLDGRVINSLMFGK